MKVETSARNYSVQWEYVKGTMVPHPYMTQVMTDRDITMCYIEDADTGEIVKFSRAQRNPIDKFNKEEARKITLERAITEFSREHRTAFWLAYFNRTN